MSVAGSPGPLGCDEATCPFVVRLAQRTDTGAIVRTLPFGATRRTFRTALHGFAARLTADQAAALQIDPRVLSVTPDHVATISDTETPATWGLDRIDQRDRPLSGGYDYDPSDGAGVKAYVLDTGIRATHQEFGSRVISGVSFATSDGVTDDCNGHGTHVAGTIGGERYGVAKAVTIVPVRVIGCDGRGLYSADPGGHGVGPRRSPRRRTGGGQPEPRRPVRSGAECRRQRACRGRRGRRRGSRECHGERVRRLPGQRSGRRHRRLPRTATIAARCSAITARVWTCSLRASTSRLPASAPRGRRRTPPRRR